MIFGRRPAPRSPWRSSYLWALLLVSALALAAAGLWYFGSAERSFAVTAATRGAEITMQGEATNRWFIPSATVCFRQAGPQTGSQPANDTVAGCDPRVFNAVAVENLEVEWPDGSALRLSRTGPAAGFAIQLVAQGERPALVQGRPFLRGSRIVIGPAQWPETGTLAFSGELRIGDAPGTGSQYTLIEGAYQVREILTFRNSPTTTSQGTFFPADAIAFVGLTDRPVRAYGLIEPFEQEAQGFRVTAYSPSGANRLVIRRFNAQNIEIESSWIERALSDSYFTGSATLFGVLSAIAGLISTLRGLFSRNSPSGLPVDEERPRKWRTR